jgi:ATP-binding cassette subfamily B protein
VKIFGIDFISGRFKTLSDKFYSDNSKLVRRSIWNFLSVLGTLGYYAAYAFIIYETVTGNRL